MPSIGPIARSLPVNLFIGPFGYLYTAPGGSVGVAANNDVNYCAFQVFRPVTVTTAVIQVITQSGNLDIGILDSSGNRLASTGSFACPAAGTISQALTASLALSPSTFYYAAVAMDNTTARVNGVSIASSSLGRLGSVTGNSLTIKNTTSFPIPATNPVDTGEFIPANVFYVYFK